MEILNLEHFIFCSDILFIYSQKNEKDQQNTEEITLIPVKLLCSINSFYFYTQDFKNIIQKDNSTNLQRQNTDKSSLNPYQIPDNNLSTSGMGKRQNISSKSRSFEDSILLKLHHVDIYLSDYNLETFTLFYKPFSSNFKNVFKNTGFINTQYQNVVNAKNFKFRTRNFKLTYYQSNSYN